MVGLAQITRRAAGDAVTRDHVAVRELWCEDLHKADGDTGQAGDQQPPAKCFGGALPHVLRQALGEQQYGQAGADDGGGAEAQGQG